MRLIFIIILALSFSILSNAQIFKEVSNEIGLNYIYPGTDLQMAGSGVMVFDVNNDGWDDFYQCGGVFDSKLWVNKKGRFIDATKEYGLEILNGYFTQGAISFDFNNDGFQDFLIANYGVGMNRGDKKAPVLMVNQGGEFFKPFYLDSILPIGDYSSANVGDINNDGFTDVYLTNYVASMGEKDLDDKGMSMGYNGKCFENKLLLNCEGKTFRECAQEYGVDDIGCGLSASFIDLDKDGDQDLIVLNDFGEWTNLGNRYFRNDFPNGAFIDASDEVGFNQKMYGMCVGAGDFDGDASFEFYVTNIGQNYLFQYSAGEFIDEAKKQNLDDTFVKDSVRGTSWSALFFDLEFDGDLDLYVAKGNVMALTPRTAYKDPNKLYLNENGILKNVSDSSGVDDILSHRGAGILDFDHDGDLDIVSNVAKLPWASFAKKEQKIKLFRNDIHAKNFVAVRLEGVDDINRDCFGCQLVSEQNGRKLLQQIDGGSGHASQSSKTIYIGLNNARKLELLTINWTNQKSSTFRNLKKGNIYTIKSTGEMRIQHY